MPANDAFQEKRLAYLYNVGVYGGIRKAADALGVNPSVISRQVAQLERQLHLPLLERRGRNVVLSQAGKLLADHFAETCARREVLGRQLTDLRYLRGGTVNLRIGQGMVGQFVDDVLRDFARQYPDVFVDISSGDFSATLMLLAQGELDMSMSFGPIGSTSLHCRSFPRGPVCAGMAADHPLAGRARITPRELAEHRLIALPDVFGIQRYVNRMFEADGVPFTPAYRCNLLSSAQTLCQAGLGIAFMSRQAVQPAMRASLVTVPVDHPIAHESQCHILRSSDRRLSPAAEHLWRLLVSSLERNAAR